MLDDDTLNKLARYVHKTLDLNNLDCCYDLNKEKCRSCKKRTSTKKIDKKKVTFVMKEDKK